MIPTVCVRFCVYTLKRVDVSGDGLINGATSIIPLNRVEKFNTDNIAIAPPYNKSQTLIISNM